MPSPADDLDPIERKRRELTQKILLVETQRMQLRERLEQAGQSLAKKEKPPTWREEEETPRPRDQEIRPYPRRSLAGQRQRDKGLFLLMAMILIGVATLFFWLWHHYTKVL